MKSILIGSAFVLSAFAQIQDATVPEAGVIEPTTGATGVEMIPVQGDTTPVDTSASTS